MALAHTPSKLQMKVITSSREGLLVNSTLIYGEKDAILIDTAFTLSDAHRLVADILDSKKNLTTVYITHSHPSYYFGLSVLKQVFPHIKIKALAASIDAMKNSWEIKLKEFKSDGNSINLQAILPESIQEADLILEGESFEISTEIQSNNRQSSYVWIPSLKAVICGDIAYSGVYPCTAETTIEERQEWIKVLDKIAALNPAVIVPGHQDPKRKNVHTILQFMKEYLTFYDIVLPSSKKPEELKKKIKSKYPDLCLETILESCAESAFK